tara:strand:+ start:1081 stop:1188 length:108 start_codon:yes stop_codon:yes gene_type:complete
MPRELTEEEKQKLNLTSVPPVIEDVEDVEEPVEAH